MTIYSVSAVASLSAQSTTPKAAAPANDTSGVVTSGARTSASGAAGVGAAATDTSSTDASSYGPGRVGGAAPKAGGAGGGSEDGKTIGNEAVTIANGVMTTVITYADGTTETTQSATSDQSKTQSVLA